MSEKREDDHVTVKIPKELAGEADSLIGKHGFRSRAEITKEALRSFLAQYGIETKPEPKTYPRMVRVNATDQGATIWDNQLKRQVDVVFSRNGIKCSVDDTDICEHVAFALKEPDVKAAFKKRRREGWKLPDV